MFFHVFFFFIALVECAALSSKASGVVVYTWFLCLAVPFIFTKNAHVIE